MCLISPLSGQVHAALTQPNTCLYQQEHSKHLKIMNYSLLLGIYETTTGHCVQYNTGLAQQVQRRAVEMRGWSVGDTSGQIQLFQAKIELE